MRRTPRINSPINANTFLLPAKRLRRIDLRCAPRRYVAGYKSHGDWQQGDAQDSRNRYWILPANIKNPASDRVLICEVALRNRFI